MITSELGPSEGAHGVQVHGAGELYMRDVTLQGGGGRAHGTQPLHVSSAEFAQGVHTVCKPTLISCLYALIILVHKPMSYMQMLWATTELH